MVGQIMETLDRLRLSDSTLDRLHHRQRPAVEQPPRADQDLRQVRRRRHHATAQAPRRQIPGEMGRRHARADDRPLARQSCRREKRRDALAAGFDLFTTFAAAAGVRSPGRSHHRRRRPHAAANGGRDGRRIDQIRARHVLLLRDLGLAAVRKGDYKLILPGRPPPDVDKTLLFNVREDPGETKDLAADHPELVARAAKARRRSPQGSRRRAEQPGQEPPAGRMRSVIRMPRHIASASSPARLDRPRAGDGADDRPGHPRGRR